MKLQQVAPGAPPRFASDKEYKARLTDIDYWQPYVAAILRSHGLTDKGQELIAGIGGTYPTFICGDIVVKLFGHVHAWHKGFTAERTAQAVLATDPELAVPRLLATGQLYPDAAVAWPYLVVTRIPGRSWEHATLSFEEQLSVAADLGRQLQRVHTLQPSGVLTHQDWLTVNVVTAAAQSSLPPHLLPQIERYLAKLPPFDNAFVHGDLMFRHAFAENGRLSGIIDWGDAIVTDRHYEFAKMHLDLFHCNKQLLRAFLHASNWPVAKDFAHKAMGHALYRQAHGLAQHPTIDVFYMLPEMFSLKDIGTLEELAEELFGV